MPDVRTVTILINYRCPLRCRHCAVGALNPAPFPPIDARVLAEQIEAIDRRIYQLVMLAGGEPALNPELIRVAIDAAQRRKLACGIVTAPIWARTPHTAARFIGRTAGLKVLILSYDRFHLEWLTRDHYKFAVSEAVRAGMRVFMKITPTSDAELEQLTRSLEGIGGPFTIWSSPVVPVGNATDLPVAEPFEIRSGHDVASVQRCCLAGQVMIDREGDVHGCCYASLGDSPLSVRDPAKPVAVKLQELERSAAFRAIQTRGFIDALSSEGREIVARLMGGAIVSNECDLCIRVLKRGGEVPWTVLLADNVQVVA